MPTLSIAITGASGLVGRHVAEAALDGGHEVRALTRRAERISQPGLHVVEGGLEPGPLDELLRGAQVLVHLAHIGSEKRGDTFEAVNVSGTRAVLDAARRVHVERVVMFSGLGVASYGRTERCTNRYFRSKLAAETTLFATGVTATVFRPSYIVGPGDGLLRHLLSAMKTGRLVRPGDGRYRMQPIAVGDAAAAVLVAATGVKPLGPDRPAHRVLDLVGPEPITYADLVQRLAVLARAEGRPAAFDVAEVPIDEADRQARGEGFLGQGRDDLDCLLCDEVADPRPLQALLGRPLRSLEDALRIGVRGTP